MNTKALSLPQQIGKTLIFIFCIILTVLSILPFWTMFMNATRSTPEIQQRAIGLLPSVSLLKNYRVFAGADFNPIQGFFNSLLISACSTALVVYFSSLTAYGLTAYNWKMRRPFFTFIMVVMMVPGQITSIGFYQFMYKIGLNGSFLPLIIPAIAAPGVVFFMRQYLMATFSIDIVNSARIDSAGEFRIFNLIMLPIMKPAIATQAIFAFVNSWNNYLIPQILLGPHPKKYTMPMMVQLLRGDIYKTELGAIYLGLSLTVLPLFIVYFALSKYIVAGVALGGVKE